VFVVTIETDVCIGCGECVAACPAQIIAMVQEQAAVTGDLAECLGCESCVIICEQQGITLQEF
jgi:NAD-dependent dihydropyrimidine dehydrogenase PreA subunit